LHQNNVKVEEVVWRCPLLVLLSSYNYSLNSLRRKLDKQLGKQTHKRLIVSVSAPRC
jgi:hypothetical protein